ncbi:hypothetical protein FSP39_000708 [Pinctada imbricata]|uniref:Arginase n=1 Tax=Pinctada imbricata TaxID=66713 RepID=A0AA88XUV6_PINIB|nr:hypothetical protein FSP39_000708 [Pinctada imbricata]
MTSLSLKVRPMKTLDLDTPPRRFHVVDRVFIWESHHKLPKTRLTEHYKLTISKNFVKMPFFLNDRSSKVGVIGVPIHMGQPRPGTEHGPEAMREGGLISKLEGLGLDVEDQGDLFLEKHDEDIHDHPAKNVKNVGSASSQIADSVYNTIKSGRTCLALGGDHSMAIGSIYGHSLAEPDHVVIWVDAHADINTPLTSSSGNMHGMPLSFLVKEVQPYLPDIPHFDNIKPCLSAKNIAYIGLRDVDPGERYIIEKLGIHSFSMTEVDKFGIKDCVEKALHAVDPEGNKPIHLSFDIDALDPSLAPSTGTPVPGGLSIREGNYIAEELAATGRLTCVDLAEVNPKLGNDRDNETTVRSAITIIQHCFGNRRQGVYPKDYKFPIPEKVVLPMPS